MRRLFLIVLAATLAACSTTDSVSTAGAIGGAFQLKTVNGSNLPFTFSTGESVVSDVLTLYLDGTYIDVAQLSDGNTVPETGTYTNNNNVITFAPNGATSTYSGAYSDGTTIKITFSDGTVEVYQRT
jgi:hypothetical protein